MSFIDATRQNFTELPAQPYVANGRLYFTLPKAGLLSRLFVKLKGVMTVTLGGGTAVVSEKTMFNLIKRIRLIANSGTAIFDVSGYGTYLINQLLNSNCSPDKSVFDRTYLTEVYNCPVSAGANNWIGGLIIPIAMNVRDPIGMIMLQNDSTNLTLEIEFNPEYGLLNNDIYAVVVTGAAVTSFAGTVSVNMEYFNVPKNAADFPPLNIVHQWLENRDALSSTGAFVKSLQRGNIYQRIIHNLTLANLLDTTDVDKFRILYNQSEVPYTTDKLTQLILQRSRYGMDLPKGCYVHDFTYSTGEVGLGNSRDYINSANVTELQSEVTINSGATVTAGQSFLNTISEQLIRLA